MSLSTPSKGLHECVNSTVNNQTLTRQEASLRLWWTWASLEESKVGDLNRENRTEQTASIRLVNSPLNVILRGLTLLSLTLTFEQPLYEVVNVDLSLRHRDLGEDDTEGDEMKKKKRQLAATNTNTKLKGQRAKTKARILSSLFLDFVLSFLPSFTAVLAFGNHFTLAAYLLLLLLLLLLLFVSSPSPSRSLT
jgi:hypothetical protein